jgi:predicted Zn-dependent protease
VVLKVIEFLQETKRPAANVPQSVGVAPTGPAPAGPDPLLPLVIEEGPVDLLCEFTFNYQVAKALLKQTLVSADRSVDPDETRKNLRVISAFMDSMLKYQERLFNVQQMQRFQEAVFTTMEEAEPGLRKELAKRLLGADL